MLVQSTGTSRAPPLLPRDALFILPNTRTSQGGWRPLRMYCIDRARVPETHNAHGFHCLYDYCILEKHANPCENRMNSKAVRAASVKHKY